MSESWIRRQLVRISYKFKKKEKLKETLSLVQQITADYLTIAGKIMDYRLVR